MERYFMTSDGYVFVELEDGTLTNGDLNYNCIQDAMDDDFTDLKEISKELFDEYLLICI